MYLLEYRLKNRKLAYFIQYLFQYHKNQIKEKLLLKLRAILKVKVIRNNSK